MDEHIDCIPFANRSRGLRTNLYNPWNVGNWAIPILSTYLLLSRYRLNDPHSSLHYWVWKPLKQAALVQGQLSNTYQEMVILCLYNSIYLYSLLRPLLFSDN